MHFFVLNLLALYNYRMYTSLHRKELATLRVVIFVTKTRDIIKFTFLNRTKHSACICTVDFLRVQVMHCILINYVYRISSLDLLLFCRSLERKKRESHASEREGERLCLRCRYFHSVRRIQS